MLKHSIDFLQNLCPKQIFVILNLSQVVSIWMSKKLSVKEKNSQKLYTSQVTICYTKYKHQLKIREYTSIDFGETRGQMTRNVSWIRSIVKLHNQSYPTKAIAF